MKLCEFATG